MWFSIDSKRGNELKSVLIQDGFSCKSLRDLLYGPFRKMKTEDWDNCLILIQGLDRKELADRLKPYTSFFDDEKKISDQLEEADGCIDAIRRLYILSPCRITNFSFAPIDLYKRNCTYLKPYGLDDIRCAITEQKDDNQVILSFLLFHKYFVSMYFRKDVKGDIINQDKLKNPIFQAKYDNVTTQEKDKQLRPYQEESKQKILNGWEKMGHILFQMPTGTGKTRLFVSIINDLMMQDKENSILIVAHREELINQISEHLTKHYDLEHGIIQGSNPQHLECHIQVASIQTLFSAKNEEQMKQLNFNYIIIDEAHHSLAPTYLKLWTNYPQARILGVTATPWRMGNKSFRKIYDTLIQSPGIKEFIRQGYLCSYDYLTITGESESQKKLNALTRFGVDGDYQQKDLNVIMNNDGEIERLWNIYDHFAQGKKGIIYAVNRSHSENIERLFQTKGIRIVSIDSKTPPTQRKLWVTDFKKNRLDVIVNVDIFSEGFDCPDVEFILLARPTRSLAKYLQQVGRGLRPSPNKSYTQLLDAVGLYSRFGLPDANRSWAFHFHGKVLPQEDYSKPLKPYHASEDGELMCLVHEHNSDYMEVKENEEVEIVKKGKYYGLTNRGKITLSPIYSVIKKLPNGCFLLKDSTQTFGLADAKGRLALDKCYRIDYQTGTNTMHIQPDMSVSYYLDNNLQVIPDETLCVNGLTLYRVGVYYSFSLSSYSLFTLDCAEPFGKRWVKVEKEHFTRLGIAPETQYLQKIIQCKNVIYYVLNDYVVGSDDMEYKWLESYPFLIGPSSSKRNRLGLFDTMFNEILSAERVEEVYQNMILGLSDELLIVFNLPAFVFEGRNPFEIGYKGNYWLSTDRMNPILLFEKNRKLHLMDTLDGRTIFIEQNHELSIRRKEISTLSLSPDRQTLSVTYQGNDKRKYMIG